MLSWLRERLAKKEAKPSVTFDDNGFVISDPDKDEVRARWGEIREVFAFKDDLWSYDEICIGFRFDDDGSFWWIGESFNGYSDLADSLEQRFPGIRTDWFNEVAFPAFAPCRTTLWEG